MAWPAIHDGLGMITPAMAAFVFATTAAPGPNAALMLAVGSRAGLLAGLPILLGLATGNAMVKGTIAASIRALATLDPLVIELGRWVAAALTIWLAWRLIRRVGTLGGHRGATGFADAFTFALVNPKATITGFAAATLFCASSTDELGHAIAFSALGFPSVLIGSGAWLVLGKVGSSWLRGPRAMRALNIAVGATLVVSLAPVLLS